MSKHTPGPWVLHPTTYHPAVRSLGTTDKGPRRICTVGTMSGNPVDRANARLIAAAPELLEALETLNLVIGLTPIAGNKDALQAACNIARAAIRKAKGEQQ